MAAINQTRNPWFEVTADDGTEMIRFRGKELRVLKSQASPKRKQPKRKARGQEPDPEEGEEDAAVAWRDVPLRHKFPGTGWCEGKVIEHQEQDTYLVEWSYPNPLGGDEVTFRQSAGVREIRQMQKPKQMRHTR